jgi:hypothetical protein
LNATEGNAVKLVAKVFTCEDFERTSGRFEKIYGIDLMFDGSDSISGLLLEEGSAIKVII